MEACLFRWVERGAPEFIGCDNGPEARLEAAGLVPTRAETRAPDRPAVGVPARRPTGPDRPRSR